MRTKESLIQHLKNNTRVLTDSRIEKALRSIDRADFVPKELQSEAYGDYPLPIGFCSTISQPTTVAFMLEKLDVRPGQKVLDVGSGSGWTTALLAHLVGARGNVIGLKIIPELVALGQQNLAKHYSPIRANERMARNAEIRQAKKGIFGLPEEAPFDRILVSAAAQEIPDLLMVQLKTSGRMLIPVGGEGVTDFERWQATPFSGQSIVLIKKKKDGSVESEQFPGFAFVPLR